MLDLMKAELLRTVTDRLKVEIRETRLIAEELSLHLMDQVTLTRLEAHATKLEVYTDMLEDVLEEKHP